MTGKKLARHVTVAGATYGPGDNVPADIAKQIRNPKAWIPLDEDSAQDEPDANRNAGTRSGRRLATAVTVGARTYGPNDFVPDDVAEQIKNPKAWEGGSAPAATAVETPDKGEAAAEPTTDGAEAPVGGADAQAGGTEAGGTEAPEKPRKSAPAAKRS